MALSGDRIVSGSCDCTVRVWDAQTGQPIHTLEGHTDHVKSVTLSGDRIVSQARGRETIVWDLATGERLRDAPRSSQGRVHQQGAYLATAQPLEAAVVDHNGQAIAWFSTRLDHLIPHPDGLCWAGRYANHVYLICLEDAPADGPSSRDASRTVPPSPPHVEPRPDGTTDS